MAGTCNVENIKSTFLMDAMIIAAMGGDIFKAATDIVDLKINEAGNTAELKNNLYIEIMDSGMVGVDAAFGEKLSKYIAEKPAAIDNAVARLEYAEGDRSEASLVKDPLVDMADSLSTNVDVEIIPDDLQVKKLLPPEFTGAKRVDLRKVQSRYFSGKLPFLPEFYSSISTMTRDILLGNRLEEGQTMNNITGPTRNMSTKYTDLVARLRDEAGPIQKLTNAQINKAFATGNAAIKNAYFAHIAVGNMELFLDILAPGGKFKPDSDAKGLDATKQRFARVQKYKVLKGYKKALKAYIAGSENELSFSIENSTDAEKENIVKELTSRKEGAKSVTHKFVAFKDVPKGYSVARFNADFPGIVMQVDDDAIDRIGNNDVFVMAKGKLIRASGNYVLTYDVSDSHKTGHEDDFNGFDNDTGFIKFLVKSTPRLLLIDGVLVQDKERPYLTDNEFYKATAEISNIPDRSFEGIGKWIKTKKMSAGSNGPKETLYRSLYYAYFALPVDVQYAYIPSGSEKLVNMVSLGAVANVRRLQFKEKGDATDMISALVQFMSKQNIGRIYFKDGKLTEFNSAETRPFDIILPDNIISSMFSGDKEVHPIVAEHITSVSAEGNAMSKNRIDIKFASSSVDFTVKVSMNAQNKQVIEMSRDDFSVNELQEIFKGLNFPPRFQHRKFLTKLAKKDKFTVANFIGSAVSVAALRDSSLSKHLRAAPDAVKKSLVETIVQVISNSTNQAVFRKNIKYISEVFEEEYGLGSPSYDITAEGNKAARYTNIDREGQLQAIRDKGRNVYNEFFEDNGVEAGDDIYNYTDTSDILRSEGVRMQKDGIENDEQLFGNSNMTVQMRIQHMVEGTFFTKLGDSHENNNFYVQPMVYSDRSTIYMYKYSFPPDFDLKSATVKDLAKNNFLTAKNPGVYSKLKKNYIETYRGKYNSMQYNVHRNWVEFLLSSELETLGLDADIIAKAKKLGYTMAKMTREDLNGTNAFEGIGPKIAALGIPLEVAVKSSFLSKGLSVSSHNGVAVPTPNSGLMAKYLASDTNAVKFLNSNIKNTLNTFSNPKINYKKFRYSTNAALQNIFGRTPSFKEAMAFYHLSTAPLNDSLIDTLMSPDTEYGNNDTSVKMMMNKEELNSSSFLEMLTERSKNFMKQSKRVQSMGTKGIRPRVFRSAGHYRRALPKYDLYFGPSDEQVKIVNQANPEDKLSAAISAGIITSVKGKYLTNKSMAITVGGYTAFLMPVEGSPGEYRLDEPTLQSREYTRATKPEFKNKLDTLLKQINDLHIVVTVDDIVRYNNDDITQEELMLLQDARRFSTIDRMLKNDEGEAGLGIEDTSKQILINEDDVRGEMHLLGALGKGGYNSQDSLDAVQWAHPMYFLKLNGSLGNEFSSFSTDGSGVKDLTQHVDPRTGRLILQKKSTQNVFSNEILKSIGNERLHSMFKKMNTAVTFDTGINVLIPDVDSIGAPLGTYKTKFFASTQELLDHPRVQGDVNKARELFKDFDTFHNTQLNGAVVEVPIMDKNFKATGETQFMEFQNLDQMWKYFGSFMNDASWGEVAKVLAVSPRIRNAYVEKVGFNSGQKTGALALNGGNVLLDANTPINQIAFNDVPNDAHVVMLQKFHEHETSDAVGHPSELSIPSQFVSAMVFEGRTMLEALNAVKGISMLTEMKLQKFYMNIALAIAKEGRDNPSFAEAEPVIEYVPTGLDVNGLPFKSVRKKFSQLPPAEINSTTIQAFDIATERDASFKNKLYHKMALEKIASSIDEERDSIVILSLVDDAGSDDIAFNSLIMREKAVNTMRSDIHSKNIRVKLPGVIAITSPSDFISSIYETSNGRMPRMDAIKYSFESENYEDLQNITAIAPQDFQALLDANTSILDSDLVRVTTPYGDRLMYATLAASYPEATKIEYITFKGREVAIADSDEDKQKIQQVMNTPGASIWAGNSTGKSYYTENSDLDVIDFDTYFASHGKAKWLEATNKTQTAEIYQDVKDFSGGKTASKNVKIVKNIFENRDDQNIITAYRVDLKKGLLKSFTDYNAIGNPIPWKGKEKGQASMEFAQWLEGTAFTDLEQEYREALLGAINSGVLKGKNIEYYQELNIPSHATVLDYFINGGQLTKAPKPENFTIHSGGAVGADTAWDTTGKSFNVDKVNHYYTGNKTPKGNVKLDENARQEGINEVRKAGVRLGKTPKKQSTLDLLGRNWFQIKNSTQVNAVANISPNMVDVEGGTGWAVAMAQENNKEINVFNQRDNSWYSWNGTQFVKSSTPVLANNFAGIGSRQLTSEGSAAIKAAYANTFTKDSNVKPGKIGKKEADNILEEAWKEAQQEAQQRGIQLFGGQKELLALAKKGRITIDAVIGVKTQPEYIARITKESQPEGSSSFDVAKQFLDNAKAMKESGQPIYFTDEFLSNLKENRIQDPGIQENIDAQITELELNKTTDLAKVAKNSPEARQILETFAQAVKTVKAGNMSMGNSGIVARDYVRSIHDGEIIPAFYAKRKYGSLSGFELYTDTDTDLNWYKYSVAAEAGVSTPLEEEDVFQKNYLINKDPEVYFKEFESNNLEAWKGMSKKSRDIQVKRRVKRFRGQLRLFMEKNNIEVTIPEAYAPNFNMEAFLMTPEDLVSDVIGFNKDPKAEKNKAESFFISRLYKEGNASVDGIETLSKENYLDVRNRFRKLSLKDSNTARIEVYNKVLAEFEAVDVEANLSLAKPDFGKLKTRFNKVLRAENTRQIRIAASKMAASFIASLEVMPPRIPGQGKQSGALMRIKAFVESNKNAFYAPREYYLNSGQDNDIDTNNVITRAIDSHGFQYTYKEYLMQEGDIDKDGNPIDPKYYGQIMLSDGTNPRIISILSDFGKTIEKAVEVYSASLETPLTPEAKNEIISKKVQTRMRAVEKGIQNFVIDEMKKIMRSSANAVELETPITMDDLKESIESSSVKTAGYDYNKHGIQSFNSAWLAVLEQLNMEGRLGIANFANGQRTLSGIMTVQYDLGRDLYIGSNVPVGKKGELAPSTIERINEGVKNNKKNIKLDHSISKDGKKKNPNFGFVLTIDGKPKLVDSYANSDINEMPKKNLRGDFSGLTAEENVEADAAIAAINNSEDFLGDTQAWEQLSQLLTAATDNAKELLLGRLGANNDTNTIITTMILLGFDISDIRSFLNQSDLIKTFKQFNGVRNAYKFAYLKSFLEKKLRDNKGSLADKELLDVIKVGEQMASFRRILTISQDNKIETRDLYKAMTPLYTVQGEIKVNELLKKGSYVGSSEVIKDINGDILPFNPLFFISNHSQGRVILKATETAENIITSISRIDYILGKRIKKIAVLTGKIISQKTYDNLSNYINESLLVHYMKDKRMYLPGQSGTYVYDLSDPDLRADGVYNIHKSVEFVRNKLNAKNTPNAFLNAIEFKESSENRGKSLINIPYLMEAEISEKSMYELAIDELMVIEGPEGVEARNLVEALFLYSIITGKGKESRNSLVSLFPERYVEFSKELGRIDIEHGTDIGQQMMTSKHDLLFKIIDSDAHKTVGTATMQEMKNGESAYEDTPEGHRAKARDKALFGLKAPLPTPKVTEDENYSRREIIIKYTHPRLAQDLFVETQLSTDKIFNRIPIKLFKKNTDETIKITKGIDLSSIKVPGISSLMADDIYSSGHVIGLQAFIGPGVEGRVLAYLGAGRYAVLNSNNELEITTDTALEDGNKNLVFYGHDFRKARSWEIADERQRSFRASSFKPGSVDDSVSVIGNSLTVHKKDGKEYNIYPRAVKRKIISEVFDRQGENSIFEDMARIFKTGAESRVSIKEVGFPDANTDRDIRVFLYGIQAGVDVTPRAHEEIDVSWTKEYKNNLKNASKIKKISYTVSELVREYIKSRQALDYKDTQTVDDTTKLLLSVLTGTRSKVIKTNYFESLLETLSDAASNLMAKPIHIDNTDLDYADKICKL